MKRFKTIKSKKWARRRNRLFLKTNLPKINRIFPRLIMHEIASVQPLSQGEFQRQMDERKAKFIKTAKFGDFYPSFFYGYIFNGKELVDIFKFVNWFGLNNINKKYIKQRDLRGNL